MNDYFELGLLDALDTYGIKLASTRVMREYRTLPWNSPSRVPLGRALNIPAQGRVGSRRFIKELRDARTAERGRNIDPYLEIQELKNSTVRDRPDILTPPLQPKVLQYRLRQKLLDLKAQRAKLPLGNEIEARQQSLMHTQYPSEADINEMVLLDGAMEKGITKLRHLPSVLAKDPYRERK